MVTAKTACPNLSATVPAVARQDWWRCFFEQAEDAQLVCDAEGLVVEANRRAAQLFGIPSAPGNGEPFSFCQALTASAGRKLRELFQTGRSGQEDLTAVTVLCEGQLGFIADLRITPLSEGVSLVTVRDASRRWRMESQVQRLMTAVNSTTDVVFLTDAEFRLAFVNVAFQTVTGYTIEDALGRTADFLRAPASEQKIKDYLCRITAGMEWQGELENVRTDGVSYPVEATISPIYDGKGTFLGYVSFERDISQKKRLQNELRIEHNYVLSIINSLDAAVYTVDRQFRLSHINEGWKKLPSQHGWLNIQSAPRAGCSLFDYVDDPLKKAELRTLFEKVMASGRTEEMQSVSPDHSQWSMKIAPWLHEGEVRGVIYVVSDQTQFHALQQQLYQAQKMEIIGALAAGVAHDFNNLLQAVRGNAGLLLLEAGLQGRLRHQVQQIDQAATRAADITQQLLSFSRASDENVAVLDFNQVIREACDLALRSLSCKVELKLEPAPSPAKVRMDTTRAQQLLLNLCVNALDAMPQGGQLVLRNTVVPLSPSQVEKVHGAASHRFLCCSVSDNGVGIAREHLPRIFDPFFTTKDKKGTGLGLAIVHGIVKQASGFIEVESTPDHGTTFFIYLPLVEADVTPKARPSRLHLAKGTGRVLVVDDLDLVLDFTRTFLLTAGYQVIVASSAEDALAILESQEKPVDLLFTDYNMAGMNGWQLIRQATSHWPNMKCILASGYLEESERCQIEQDVNIRILNKPFHMRDAAGLIADMLAPPAGSLNQNDAEPSL